MIICNLVEHFFVNLVVNIENYITFVPSKKKTHIMVNRFFTYFYFYFYFSR